MERHRSDTLVGLILSILLISTLGYAQQNWIGVSAGASKAIGTGSEDLSTGFISAISIFGQPSNNLLFGGRIGYNYLPIDTEEIEAEVPGLDLSGSFTIFEFMPAIRLVGSKLADGEASPFLQVGAGMYHVSAKLSATYAGSSDSDSDSTTRFGLNFGAGFLAGTTGSVRFEFGPNFNIIFTEIETTKYFTLNLGLLINRAR